MFFNLLHRLSILILSPKMSNASSRGAIEILNFHRGLSSGVMRVTMSIQTHVVEAMGVLLRFY